MSHFRENSERKESCELLKDEGIVTDIMPKPYSSAKHTSYVIILRANWHQIWRKCF